MIVRVVAAAIVRGDRVLAARRAAGSRLAGGWEFPGGKVEAGEDDRTALARECREELDVDVVVGEHIGTAGDGDLVVALYDATTTDEPRPLEDHDELRWVSAGELAALEWLPLDRELIAGLSQWMRDQ